jgi:hypothetical protein
MVSAPKTRPTDASVDDFLAAVEDPRRRADAEAVRDLMTEISGEPAGDVHRRLREHRRADGGLAADRLLAA